MMENASSLKINTGRFLSDFHALAQIGATAQGGVNRPSFSDAHLQARGWFKDEVLQAGLAFRCDEVGNHSAFLDCGSADAQTLLIGSHLDSVYQGGRFDGALGVMAALEVLRTLKETGIQLPFHLEAVDFTDEEGTLVGMLGSQALTGKFHAGVLEETIAGKAATLAALEKGGLHVERISEAARSPRSLCGYLELHIEQGSRLDAEGVQIGVVTGIVGMRAMRVTYTGRANHAGTTSMNARQDAGLGASALHMAAHQCVMEEFPECVLTVGQMSFKPGGVNIIPAEAVLSFDYRTIHLAELERLEKTLLILADEQAERFALEVRVEKTLAHAPALMDEGCQNAIVMAADVLGLSYVRMPSGAGHDAQNMAAICPSAMVFVPSVGGLSHCPQEYTPDEDCVNGANVLLQAVLALAEG